MGRARTFSREIMLSVVREVATGAKRPVQICREHTLSDGMLHRWRPEYDQRGDAASSEYSPSSMKVPAGA